YQDNSFVNLSFGNMAKYLAYIQGQWPVAHKGVDLRYRGFPGELTQNYTGYQYFGTGGGYGFVDHGWARGEFQFTGRTVLATAGMPAPGMHAAPAQGGFGGGMEKGVAREAEGAPGRAAVGDPVIRPGATQPPSPGPDLGSVSPRKNLNETAFFFPHLVSNQDGEVRIEFQVPEALTKWKLMAFAHDKELRSGFAKGDVVTAKDLMAQPNPPRFLREGDSLEFTAKVSNQGATRQKGQVRLA